MPKASHASSVVDIRGTVIAHNISPRGHVEGLLVETPRGTAQVNLPKHADPSFASSFRQGATVELRAEPEEDEGDHPVYRLVEEDREETGEVVRINYALHGEVNGFHLASGLFVHLKPEGARKHKVRVGERVTVTGERKVGPAATVLEAREVRRIRTRASAREEAMA